MERNIKKLKILAGISILFTLAFMVIAVFQFQKKEEDSSQSEQFQYFFNESWLMTSIDDAKISKEEWKDHNKIPELMKNTLKDKDFQKVELPYKKQSNSNDIFIFKNIMPQLYANSLLTFSSTNAIVCVFLDNEIIYQYGFEDIDKSQEALKNHEHFINIPNLFQDGELWIELICPYPNTVIALHDTKIKPNETIMVIGNDISGIGCCLLIIIMAIIMFVLALIRRYTLHPIRGELFLGFAGLTAGIYCFIETHTLSMLYDIQEAYEMEEYLLLLIPIFLTLYFERNLHTIYPHCFSILLLGTIGNATIQILLQILNIWNLKDIVILSLIVIIITCIIALFCLIQFHYKNKRYESLPSILSLFVLLIGFITLSIDNFFQYTYSSTILQYSIAIFSIIMATVHIFQLSKEYRLSAEESARLLEEKIKITEQQNIQLIEAKKEADIAKQEALAANKAKGTFLAHMSHEIRTPINAVLGMDEMILRESKEQDIKAYAMDIYTAGQTLLSLINDILDFSKIESGKMEIVPVKYDISTLIHDLVTMASQRAKNKNLTLEVELDHKIPSQLYGDDVRIRQVLTNILTNAIKYTHEGTIWLRVNSHIRNDIAMLTFEVEDTGIGIKEEDLPKLSTEFERIEEDKNRNIEGTGLGMNITIQLLSLLGSKLQVESTYGKGSKFYFDLEQKIIDHTEIGHFEARVREMAENYSYNAKFYAGNAKILVVDDNAMNRKVLRSLLKETKIQIEEAESGIECLELVKEHYYDLIFLDHMMPDMDGIETLHCIKKLSNSPCKNTPIIILTANAVSGAKEKYLSEGFDDFLSKPIVPEKLENMIVKMLPEKLLEKATENQKTKTLQEANTLLESKAEHTENILENLPQIDGLDWNYALLHLPDIELLEYTVKEFYAQIDSAANNLKKAYQEITEKAQLEQYRIQVHAMKSLAATIGIIPLSGIAKVLEYAARDHNIDTISSLTPIFLEEWCSYHQKLQGVFGIEAIAKKEIIDYSIIQALIEMINISMQELDIDKADNLLHELQSYSFSEEINQTIEQLAEAIINLDSEKTEYIANLLMEQIKK